MSTAEPETVPIVTMPADGVPEVVRTPDAFAASVEALASGTGPVALDTERAQSYRYASKAYLIQIRRAGAGTHLIDPVALERDHPRADLSPLAEALGDTEWVLHAASQDLPCLAEVGLVPPRLFDTELGGRLLGLPRVALGPLLETALGKGLAKEHSAADWSRRPIPREWLVYAALDVELLAPLRDWVAAELEAAGKQEWAAQEFANLTAHAGDEPTRRTDPWRRTSGVHDVRTSRGLAVVRELWTVRDQLARDLDRAPGRVLADRAISELALRTESEGTPLVGRRGLRAVPGFTWRQAARFEANWLAALDRVQALSPAELPPLRPPTEGLPRTRTWAQRHPDAAARWERVRPATVALAEELHVPVENLIPPEALRQLAWDPPAGPDAESVEGFLAAHGVRPWQRALVTPVVMPLL